MTDSAMMSTGSGVGGSSRNNGNRYDEPPTERPKPSSPRRMAYLGPPGTYGEQAARAFANRYEQGIELVPCPTIREIYNHPAPLHVMPLENTIQGGVIETLDCLLSTLDDTSTRAESSRRSNGNGNDVDDPLLEREILMDLALPIRHCLVAKKGTKLEDISWVRSHEQALGQSAEFLSKHLPKAKLHSWASTAGAAVSLLSSSSSTLSTDVESGAAICSKGVVRLYPELEILYEGTQAIENNYTRFLLIGPTDMLPPLSDSRTDECISDFYAVRSPATLPPLLVDNTLVSIHVRPAPPISDDHSAIPDSDNARFPTRYLVAVSPRTPETESGGKGERRRHKLGTYLGSLRDSITEEELSAL